jgi:uncharacterized transporter YbjL
MLASAIPRLLLLNLFFLVTGVNYGFDFFASEFQDTLLSFAIHGNIASIISTVITIAVFSQKPLITREKA